MSRNIPKLLLASFIVLSLGITSCTQPDSKPVESVAEIMEPEVSGYNEELATQLGADTYGMRSYVIAFLKTGPNRDQDQAAADSLQAAHMANIGRMADEGVLVLAGPFLDDGELRGIYLFDVETIEEARALTATDPAIQAGRLTMELHPWYGSAALMQVNEVHQTLTKTPM